MEDDPNYVEYVPVAKRRAMEAQKFLKPSKRKASASVAFVGEETHKKAKVTESNKPSLLVKASQLSLDALEIDTDFQEQELIDRLSDIKALTSVRELAKGITYTEPLLTGWMPPVSIQRMSKQKKDQIRKQWHIAVDGEEDDIPHPITNFKDMKFPKPILDRLKDEGISQPTPIQAQAIPVILSGRDMVATSFTGSGKTLTFALPMIMLALQEEMMMPILPWEGPIGLVVCPSRELAKQTYQVMEQFLDSLKKARGNPELRLLLCTGGYSIRSQLEVMKKGVHIVVATPGRLKDMLVKRKMKLDMCKQLTLDEADRLVDVNFEEDIRVVFDSFKTQRQTLMFSATMPAKVRNLARNALVKPVSVKVGRHGAANLNVIQEVEYVKEEVRLLYFLECMQKTPPPVLVFCEKKDVDMVCEYLLIKGVAAVGIHGSKDQEEREYGVSSFKAGKNDVLVATDMASKGLDFPDVKHVINLEMPGEIENYVHRIGRTGRGGRTGIATTFINKKQSETTLRDLKRVLQESKQRIPTVLASLQDDGVMSCSNCVGLAHSTSDCPKLKQLNAKALAISTNNYFGSGDYKSEF